MSREDGGGSGVVMWVHWLMTRYARNFIIFEVAVALNEFHLTAIQFLRSYGQRLKKYVVLYCTKCFNMHLKFDSGAGTTP